MIAPWTPRSPMRAPVVPSMMASPTHDQTVAALKYFLGVEKELKGLLADPVVGKSDIRSKIDAAVLRLADLKIADMADIVKQFGPIPKVPSDQLKWADKHLVLSVQAAVDVLDHHRVAHAGIADDQLEAQHRDFQNLDLTAYYSGIGNG